MTRPLIELSVGAADVSEDIGTAVDILKGRVDDLCWQICGAFSPAASGLVRRHPGMLICSLTSNVLTSTWVSQRLAH